VREASAVFGRTILGSVGLTIAATFSVTVAMISDDVHFSMGMFKTIYAAGFMLAATFGGILSYLYSPRTPYLLAGTAALVCAIAFALRGAE
jgi:predicted MFS family arabinose efflux permease